MDRFRFTTLAHAGLDRLGPYNAAKLEALLARVTLAPLRPNRTAVLDVGCGKGAWLLAAMRRWDAHGTGIEPNPSFAMHLRAQAAARGLAADLRLEMNTADRVVLTPSSFEVALCVGSTHALGGYRDTLAALPRLLRPQGWAVIGEGFWRRRPDPEYLAYFGQNESMMQPLDATLALARAAGWTLAAHIESSQVEFDGYEQAYEANMRRALAARPDDADSVAFRERIDAHSNAYARWGHDTFGFVSMVLRR